jgi:hypothetical protein
MRPGLEDFAERLGLKAHFTGAVYDPQTLAALLKVLPTLM